MTRGQLFAVLLAMACGGENPPVASVSLTGTYGVSNLTPAGGTVLHYPHSWGLLNFTDTGYRLQMKYGKPLNWSGVWTSMDANNQKWTWRGIHQGHGGPLIPVTFFAKESGRFELTATQLTLIPADGAAPYTGEISDAGRTIAITFRELFGEERVVSVVFHKADL